MPSGWKNTEKRVVSNLSYYSSNYAALCIAVLSCLSLFYDWGLGLALSVGFAAACVLVLVAQALPLAVRLAVGTCIILAAQLVFSTLVSFAMGASASATLVLVHAMFRPHGGAKARGATAAGHAHDVSPDNLSAFVGSLSSDLDELEARRRKAAVSAAADAEEGRGSGSGAGFVLPPERADVGGYYGAQTSQFQPSYAAWGEPPSSSFVAGGAQQRRGGGGTHFQQQPQQHSPTMATPLPGQGWQAGGVPAPWGGYSTASASAAHAGTGGSPRSQQQRQQPPQFGGPSFQPQASQLQPHAASGGYSKRAE